MNNLSLKSIFIFQLAAIILMALDIIPREFSFVVTGVFLIYILKSPIEKSLQLVILSIPFYVSLPITSSFDSMANWRILLTLLFLKWMAGKWQKIIPKINDIKKMNDLKKRIYDNKIRFEVLSAVFVIISILSLIGAPSFGTGVKKIIFLVNIFLLYILIKKTADTKEKIMEIIKSAGVASVSVLVIGYMQLALTFIYSLFDFWQYWAGNVIPVFYGNRLGQLLSISNTWFSYYGNGTPPTLRMFSVFPDSHSFALFEVLSIPFLLVLLTYFKRNAHKFYLVSITIIASLLGILLSGSRGVWVGALITIGVCFFIIGKNEVKSQFTRALSLVKNSSKGQWRMMDKIVVPKLRNLLNNELKLPIVLLLLLFLLFPISSIISDQEQNAEIRRLNNGGTVQRDSTTFKRFASVIDITETSNKGRIEIWKDTLESIKKHPILGVGIENFSIVLDQDVSASKKGASAHNIYLNVWAEMGIFGLIIFLLIFYEIWKTSYEIYKGNNEKLFKIFAAAFGIYLVWVASYGLFDVVLFNDKVLMMFMVAVGILFGIKNLKVTN